MLKFANRVTDDEVKNFIKNCGFDVHDLTMKMATDASCVHGVFKIFAYNFNFIFNDFDFQLLGIEIDGKLIKRFEKGDADISSYDWMCFLRSMFGKEYTNLSNVFKKSGNFLTTEFISELNMEDIFTIFSTNEVIIGTIKEVEAFDVGTRRFKFFSQNAIREVIIAAYYPSGSIDRCVDEVSFVKYMCKKFGKSFAEFYCKCLELDENEKKANVPEYCEEQERIWTIKQILTMF